MKTFKDKESIRSIMLDHVKHRGGSDVVRLLWKGYLAALMVEGSFSPDDYHELNDALGDIGGDELVEIFAGYPGQFD